MGCSAHYPGSSARIAELARLVERHERLPRKERAGASLFPEPRGREEELPDRVGFRELTTDNGVRVGLEFFEQTSAGVKKLAVPEPPAAARVKRGWSPWDHRRAKQAQDRHYRRGEALRKFKAKRRDPEWRGQREELLRTLYEMLDVFVHPSGQVYLWEWRSKSRRRHNREKRPHDRPGNPRPDPASLWNVA